MLSIICFRIPLCIKIDFAICVIRCHSNQYIIFLLIQSESELVAFETLSVPSPEGSENPWTPIAKHEDLTDVAQTVDVLEIATVATDAADADKYIDNARSKEVAQYWADWLNANRAEDFGHKITIPMGVFNDGLKLYHS